MSGNGKGHVPPPSSSSPPSSSVPLPSFDGPYEQMLAQRYQQHQQQQQQQHFHQQQRHLVPGHAHAHLQTATTTTATATTGPLPESAAAFLLYQKDVSKVTNPASGREANPLVGAAAPNRTTGGAPPATTIGGAPSGGTTKKATTTTTTATTTTTTSTTTSTTSFSFGINTPMQHKLLEQCDWNDKLLWATRLLLGGNSVNGFLRSTATAQRIKKQRARQTLANRKSQQKAAAAAAGLPPPLDKELKVAVAGGSGGGGGGAAAAAAAGVSDAAGTSTTASRNANLFDPDEEERLKKDVMNPRTAKKIKTELESGIVFCARLHNVLRGVLFEIDPTLTPALPPALILDDDIADPNHKPKEQTFLVPSTTHTPQDRPLVAATTTNTTTTKVTASSSISAAATATATNIFAMDDSAASAPKSKASTQQRPQQQQTTTLPTSDAPGTPHSSSLRRNRKKKLPPYTELGTISTSLPEFDLNGRRTCNKKEYQYRIFQLLRFRPLRTGDFCAARTSSRDLWILAKVLTDYPTGYAQLMPTPLEFLKLSDVRREALFKDTKVFLKDVEEAQEGVGTTHVARHLVLPLPRSFSEAANWASRLKKGSRVYGMYPHTTSLYPATVVDSTTYCRGEDDIIVVEFDGEEVDPVTGAIPTFHIPARFVTLIPRELPASQPPSTSPSGGGGNSTSTEGQKRKSTATSGGGGSNSKRKLSTTTLSAANSNNSSLDLLAGDFGGGGLDDLDLDFDKPLDSHEEDEVGPNILF